MSISACLHTARKLKGRAGEYKLGEWLQEPRTVAMFRSGTVRSLTYKATQFGPNILKDEASVDSHRAPNHH